MRKQILFWMVATSFSLNSTWAATFGETCPDLPTCAKAVGEILGQQYVFDSDFKGLVKATPNLTLTHENAEVLFTNALSMEGYTRVPLLGGKLFQIMRQRDARDSAIPTVNADFNTSPTLPDNWDIYTLKYKATNPEVVEQIARMARSFMPSNSRILAAEWSGLLLITDSAPNLKKIYEIVKANDVKPPARITHKWEEEEKNWLQRRLLEAGSGKKEEQAKPSPGKSGT